MTCCYQHGSCIVSDAMSGAEVMDIVDPNGALPLCAAFSGDNKWMCVGYDDGHATMFSITRGEIQKKHSMAVITPQSHNPNPQNTNPLPFTQGHKFRIIATAFDPSHEYVATASFDCNICVWHSINGICRILLSGHTGPVTSLAFLCFGPFLISASSDRTAR